MTVARSVLFLTLATLGAACAHHKQPSPRGAGPSAMPPADPVAALVARSDAHLAAGIAESKAGHLRKARQEFDRALDGYLSAPGGALSDPRLAEAYRRTLEAIQLQELGALAAGDGFEEAPPEPAAIDDVADLTMGGGPASEEARRRALEALRGESNELKIALNDEVLSAIDLYLGPLRDWFTAALARGGRYLPRIREVFAAEGLPQDLAYVALVESAFKTGALSRAKAKGLWQFMSYTGRRFGLRQDWWVDERSSPDKATVAAAQYLRVLHDLFGDWNLAMAAYNAGEGRIMRAMDRTGAIDFWGLARVGAIPRETQNYVPMIHAAILVAKSPETYGFAVTPDPPLAFDTVPVRGAVDLRLVAECAEAHVDEVRGLNPELRRLATPAGRGYSIKVPAGAGGTAADCLSSTPPEKRVAFRTHVVRRGQSFSAIAKRYGTSPREIAEANGLSLRRPLARGAQLIIPVRTSTAVRVARTSSSPAPKAEARLDEPGEKVHYRVRSGDTLYAIARRFKTTVPMLQQWNQGLTAHIVPGHTITLYRQD